jgi:hypothetical protein
MASTRISTPAPAPVAAPAYPRTITFGSAKRAVVVKSAGRKSNALGAKSGRKASGLRGKRA